MTRLVVEEGDGGCITGERLAGSCARAASVTPAGASPCVWVTARQPHRPTRLIQN